MSEYLGRKGQGYIQMIGFCQRCGWKYLRTELIEDDYIKGLLVCCYCHDPDHPQRYPAAPRAEGQPPMVPAPDQYPGPAAPVLSGAYVDADTVDLSWTPSADNADLIDEYFIYRSTNGGAYALIASVPYEVTLQFINGEQMWVGSATAYADDTVAPGGNYNYYVIGQAVDRRLSPQSNIFNILTIPPAPTLSGFYNFTTSAVDLAWTMPGSWPAAVVTYQIYKSVNGGAFSLLSTLSGSQQSLNDTAANSYLNNYQYYVTATVTGGDVSPNSNVASAPVSNTVIYTSAATFVKPSGLGALVAKLIGGGGGGGGASAGLSSFLGYSGSGGGGGGYVTVTYTGSSIGATEAVVVGSGGAGGAGVTTSGNGTTGSAGGSSSFGALAAANGGGGGGGGTISQPAIGSGGTASHTGGTGSTETGGAGGQGVPSNATSSLDNVGANTTNAGAGGGAGGYTKTFDTAGTSAAGGNSAAGSGGVGGAQGIITTSGPGDAIAGPAGNGVSAPTTGNGGSGGGGGGAAANGYNSPTTHLARATSGGNGGGYGGGGGGGGTSQNLDGTGGNQSGAGGNGANGVVIVTTYS